MNLDIEINVQPKSSLRHRNQIQGSGLFNRWAPSLNELASQRRKPLRGFCDLEKCVQGEREFNYDNALYSVRGLSSRARCFATKSQGDPRSDKVQLCPSCGHELFWSRNYTEGVNTLQQHSRTILKAWEQHCIQDGVEPLPP